MYSNSSLLKITRGNGRDLHISSFLGQLQGSACWTGTNAYRCKFKKIIGDPFSIPWKSSRYFREVLNKTREKQNWCSWNWAHVLRYHKWPLYTLHHDYWVKWGSIRRKQVIRWLYLSQMKNGSVALQNIFLVSAICNRLSSETSSATYHWWSLIKVLVFFINHRDNFELKIFSFKSRAEIIRDSNLNFPSENYFRHDDVLHRNVRWSYSENGRVRCSHNKSWLIKINCLSRWWSDFLPL